MTKTKCYAKPIYLMVTLALVFCLGVVAVPMAGTMGAIAPNEVWVDDTGSSCPDTGSGTQEDPYCKIQTGIDNVAPGGTVHVRAGEYTEHLVIDKSLTLQSTDGWENTNIDPLTESTIIISGDVDVTVQGFEITAGTNGIYIGLVFSTVNILDCFIHDNDFDGIRVTSSGDVLNIQRNIISQNGLADAGCGINMTQAWNTTNIVDNVIGAWTYYPEDYGDTGEPQRYAGNGAEGIHISQVGETATVCIENNKISENAVVIPNTGITIGSIYGVVTIAENDIGAWEDSHGETYLGNQDQGILISGVSSGGELTIGPDNSISGNSGHGIDVLWASSDSSIEIHDNVVDDNGPWACGSGIKLGSGGVCGAMVRDNIITNNHKGIDLDEYSTQNIIQDNLITDNGHGVWIEGDDNQILRNDILNNVEAASGIHLTSTADGNIIHCNNFEGNLPYGVYNENVDEVVNATKNWWGHVSGPSGAGTGSGDAVSENVDYSSWLPTQFQYCPECGGMPPVGGEGYPVNKLAILAPWIALFAAIIVAIAILARRRRAES
jgi:parallel beta-helix repeat protein